VGRASKATVPFCPSRLKEVGSHLKLRKERLIRLRFFSNRSNDPVVLKAKVDFKGIKRSVSFEKGDLVLKLRYLIMVAFSDVGLNKVPPASVELLKYHHGVQDYVSLPLDKKLEDNIQVKMRSSYKQNGQVQWTLSELHVYVDSCKIHVIEKTNKQTNKETDQFSKLKSKLFRVLCPSRKRAQRVAPAVVMVV